MLKLLQIISAIPGVQAVYLDLDDPENLFLNPVHCYALVQAPDDDTWVVPMDYSTGVGFSMAEGEDTYLGLLMPGEDAHETYGDAAKELRDELAAEAKKAN